MPVKIRSFGQSVFVSYGKGVASLAPLLYAGLETNCNSNGVCYFLIAAVLCIALISCHLLRNLCGK